MTERTRDEGAGALPGVAVYQGFVSPEQVRLEMPLAGPSARMLAYAIDWALLFVVQIGAVALVVLALSGIDIIGEWLAPYLPEPQDDGGGFGPFVVAVVILYFVFQFLIELAYFSTCEIVWGGRTLGKRVVGLRVVRADGLPVGAREALLRNLLRIVDALPAYYLVGLTALVVSERAQRFGDLVAGTLVVRTDREPPPPLLDSGDEDLSRFRFGREQLGAIGAAEMRLVRQTLRRLPSLAPQQRTVARERACAVLCERMALPPVEVDDRPAFLRAILRARQRG
mgnify:CR=1 FL=1